jgi:serine/threonine protein kinase
MMDYYKKALKYIYKIKKELNINKKLKHKNILNYQNYEIINKELFIYMEYMSLGSLA